MVGVAGFEPTASSSRSNGADRSARSVAGVSCGGTSVDVHGCASLCVPVVRQLVRQPPVIAAQREELKQRAGEQAGQDVSVLDDLARLELWQLRQHGGEARIARHRPTEHREQ
jgi:hypothetical protein